MKLGRGLLSCLQTLQAGFTRVTLTFCNELECRGAAAGFADEDRELFRIHFVTKVRLLLLWLKRPHKHEDPNMV